MPCYKPLSAFVSLSRKNENGKKLITFNESEAGKLYKSIELPCGRCIGCRIDRSRDWALRCVHEADLFEYNCFITLTFDDDNLNSIGSLVKSDFQKFMKRLRKKFKGLEPVRDDKGKVTYPIRYFHCGEYGSQLSRPHHHACLFNFDFYDKELWSVRNGVRLYRSEELESLWPFGFCTIGDVTFESAAYVARYITKKMNGAKGIEHYLVDCDVETGEAVFLEPEYITMSRRPGIGKRWFEKNMADVQKDFVTLNGKKFSLPAYYDKIYDQIDPDDYKRIKRKRLLTIEANADNNTMKRLKVREKVANSRFKRLERSFENGS